MSGWQQQQYDPRQQRPAVPPLARRRRPNWGKRIVAGLIVAGGLAFGLADALGGSSAPPTPEQQCVTSIGQEAPGQVTGYTPQCMALPLSERMAAIRQAAEQG